MATTHQDFDLCLEKRAPHEFVAYVPDSDGGQAAEHAFGLRTDTLKMREDLQWLEAYSLHKELVKDDFHVQFGRMLYQAALGGDKGLVPRPAGRLLARNGILRRFPPHNDRIDGVAKLVSR